MNVPDFMTSLNADRTAWRDAVVAVGEKAKATLPECNGRVEKAVRLVLAGDVTLQEDGTATVASQTDGITQYLVVNGHCECKDYPAAPHQFCKHRLSAAIAKRALALVSPTATSAVPTAPLPEAPVSITLKGMLQGQDVMITLRGIDFASVKTQVEHAAEWLSQQTPIASATIPACALHGVPLVLQHGKNGATWYSHKTADGWCQGK